MNLANGKELLQFKMNNKCPRNYKSFKKNEGQSLQEKRKKRNVQILVILFFVIENKQKIEIIYTNPLS